MLIEISFFSPRWFNNNLNCVLSVFDDFGNILTYEQFMNLYNFPVPPKEYTTLMRAIPVGLTQLIKSHLKFSKGNSVYPALCLGGIDILDLKCNNKHISDKEKDYSKRGSLLGFLCNTYKLENGLAFTTKLMRLTIKSFIKCIPLN